MYLFFLKKTKKNSVYRTTQSRAQGKLKGNETHKILFYFTSQPNLPPDKINLYTDHFFVMSLAFIA